MDRAATVIGLGILMLGAASCGAARADDFPPRKAGLWQVDMAMPGGQMRPMPRCTSSA
jgi:hypothetical protein